MRPAFGPVGTQNRRPQSSVSRAAADHDERSSSMWKYPSILNAQYPDIPVPCVWVQGYDRRTPRANSKLGSWTLNQTTTHSLYDARCV